MIVSSLVCVDNVWIFALYFRAVFVLRTEHLLHSSYGQQIYWEVSVQNTQIILVLENTGISSYIFQALENSRFSATILENPWLWYFTSHLTFQIIFYLISVPHTKAVKVENLSKNKCSVLITILQIKFLKSFILLKYSILLK